jgi:glutamyl-tRNA reductase
VICDEEHGGMTDSVVVAGISHDRTPTSLRERVHLAPLDAASLSRDLAERGHEAIVLATCNRTEVYVTGVSAEQALRNGRLALAEVGVGSRLFASGYIHADERAARHLFRVAAGLESIVLGDTHVVAQVREAHEAARQRGATGPILDRLFEAASGASKRVRAQTTVSTGVTTIAGAAVAAAARLAGPLASRRVLVVGAGAVATVAALGAASRGCRGIVVANRSAEPAGDLARRVGGRPAALDTLDETLAGADVIFCATASREFVLTDRHAAACARVARSRLIFDLALPRDVDPAFRALPGARVLDLDDLTQAVRASASTRRRDLERADAIVCGEAARWEAWRRARGAAPAITELHEDAEATRRFVLRRHAHDLAQLAPHQQRLVETITAQLVAKLLRAPTMELRRGDTAAAGQGQLHGEDGALAERAAQAERPAERLDAVA